MDVEPPSVGEMYRAHNELNNNRNKKKSRRQQPQQQQQQQQHHDGAQQQQQRRHYHHYQQRHHHHHPHHHSRRNSDSVSRGDESSTSSTSSNASIVRRLSHFNNSNAANVNLQSWNSSGNGSRRTNGGVGTRRDVFSESKTSSCATASTQTCLSSRDPSLRSETGSHLSGSDSLTTVSRSHHQQNNHNRRQQHQPKNSSRREQHGSAGGTGGYLGAAASNAATRSINTASNASTNTAPLRGRILHDDDPPPAPPAHQVGGGVGTGAVRGRVGEGGAIVLTSHQPPQQPPAQQPIAQQQQRDSVSVDGSTHSHHSRRSGGSSVASSSPPLRRPPDRPSPARLAAEHPRPPLDEEEEEPANPLPAYWGFPFCCCRKKKKKKKKRASGDNSKSRAPHSAARGGREGGKNRTHLTIRVEQDLDVRRGRRGGEGGSGDGRVTTHRYEGPVQTTNGRETRVLVEVSGPQQQQQKPPYHSRFASGHPEDEDLGNIYEEEETDDNALDDNPAEDMDTAQVSPPSRNAPYRRRAASPTAAPTFGVQRMEGQHDYSARDGYRQQDAPDIEEVPFPRSMPMYEPPAASDSELPLPPSSRSLGSGVMPEDDEDSPDGGRGGQMGPFGYKNLQFMGVAVGLPMASVSAVARRQPVTASDALDDDTDELDSTAVEGTAPSSSTFRGSTSTSALSRNRGGRRVHFSDDDSNSNTSRTDRRVHFSDDDSNSNPSRNVTSRRVHFNNEDDSVHSVHISLSTINSDDDGDSRASLEVTVVPAVPRTPSQEDEWDREDRRRHSSYARAAPRGPPAPLRHSISESGSHRQSSRSTGRRVVEDDDIETTNRALMPVRRSVCQCCYDDIPVDVASTVCSRGGHRFCTTCTRRYLEEFVFAGAAYTLHTTAEGSNALPCISSQDCDGYIEESDFKSVVTAKVWDRFQEKLTMVLSRRIRDHRKNGDDDDEDAMQAAKAAEAAAAAAVAAALGGVGGTATAVRRERKEGGTDIESQRAAALERSYSKASEAMTEAKIRRCPFCYTPILKETGYCNKMKCPTCGNYMCYICRSDVPAEGYDHFCNHSYNSCDICPRWRCQLWTDFDDADDKERLRDVATDIANQIWEESLLAEPYVGEIRLDIDKLMSDPSG